ncbi:hypothetical protein Tco_0709579 [Tanacetum coccineum]
MQSKRHRDEAQAENKDFLNKLDDNINKIIKNQVKEQVNAQVSKILPKIEKAVNEQLEAEVMTRSSTKSKTSLAIAANLSELEIKKILIEKMESNKSINRSNEQKNLYKALIEAYKSDKIILDTYEDTVLLKRHKDDEDKDEEPSIGSNRWSKRRRAGKEPESTSAPKEKISKITGKSTDGSKSQHKSAGESAHTEEPMHTEKDLEEPTHQEFDIGATVKQSNEETSQHPDWFQKPAKPPTLDCDWNKTLPTIHGSVQPWLSNLAREEGLRESFDELMDTPLDFSGFMMNRLKIDTLTPELLADPTFEMMKGTCKSLVELEYFFKEVYNATTNRLDWHNPEGQQFPHDHFINNDLAYLFGGVSSCTYATSVTKSQAADYGHIKWIEDLVPNTTESARDVYSNHKLIAVTKLQIFEWHGYKHLDWITVRRDDDKLYTFKEGDFKRLRLQDIEDMLILLDAYTAHSIPRGFIYLKKDKKNRLMHIDEIHKFSDGTLDDVRTAHNDRLKGIRMEYLPKTIWRQSDRERAKTMIQAIEKMLKSKRIIRSLERFIGGRPFDTSAGNHVKEILIKLNLPDHRILKDGGKDAKFEELRQLILGTAPSQSTHVDHVPQITKVPAKTAPYVPQIRRGYDDIGLELHNSNVGSSTTIGKNLRPKYWDVEKFHKSIIAAIKEEKNQEEEGRVPSFRVQLNQRDHKSMMKARLFWKKFVVACVRPKKPRKLFTLLGNRFKSLDLHEQLQVCIRILKKIYQDYYLLLKHTKGIQRRTWDLGITWLKILKEHLEDKVFLRGGVMIRS